MIVLFSFIIFSVVFGESQIAINNVALADGKGLVTIYADGQKKTIATSAKTIGGALKQNNITLGQGDIVEPLVDTPIDQPFYNVNVYRAYPAIIIDGDTRTTTLSGYRSPRQVVESASIKLYNEDNVRIERNNDFDEGGVVGQKIIIDRATPVILSIGGRNFEFRTRQSTVGGLLREKKININATDQLSIDLDAKIYKNMKIVLSRVSQDIIQVSEPLDPDVHYKDDPNQPVSYQLVVSPGIPGRKLVSYLVNQKDGVEQSRQELESKVTIASQPKIIVRGTKINPVADNAGLLYKLRMCEAGGNYQRNSGNGYYGAYQFSISTWNRWNTGYERADLAPASVQDEYVLKNALASKGGFWSQHPGCSTKLSLPKFP